MLMTNQKDLKEIAFWLNKLCVNITGISEELIYPHFQASLNILACSSLKNKIEGKKEVFLAVEKIKKKLGRENENLALRFHEKYLVLERNNTFRNLGAILNLLSGLSYSDDANELLSSHLFNTPNGLPCRKPENRIKCARRPQSCDLSQTFNNVNANEDFPKNGHVRSVLQFYKAQTASKLSVESPFKEKETTFTPTRIHCSAPKAPELILLKELLFAFQGIDGSVLTFDSQKNHFCVKEQANIAITQKSNVLRLAELGWLYRKVQSFCDSCCSIGTSNGLVFQSLCEALQEHLTEFYRELALLEAHVQGTADEVTTMNKAYFTLIQMNVWAWNPIAKFKMLAQLVDMCKNMKGGALISQVYMLVNIGDPKIKELFINILTKICKPFLSILCKWVFEGELDDPSNEFFVTLDNSMNSDSWWHEKYHLRESMIPKFISGSLGKKILGAGKNINFLRQLSENWKPGNSKEILDKSWKTSVLVFLEEDQEGSLSKLMNNEYKVTSNEVLQLLIKNYNFFNHLKAIRRYLLREQGDFINHLMEHLEPELCKPANSLYPHNMSSILDITIRNTNAQFDDKDILARLDTRMLDGSLKDTGWDVFTLDYHVDGPIGTVLTAECMVQYRMLFNTLWITKRMEMMLSNLWKQQMCAIKLYRTIPEVQRVMHSLHLILSEMIRFITEMSFYMTFEVVECQFVCFEKQLQKAETLDQVISAHQSFLQNVFLRLFLHKNSQKLLTQLRAIYDLILQLGVIQKFVFSETEAELALRLKYSEKIEERGAKGLFGTNAQEEQEENNRKCKFMQESIPQFKAKLKVLKYSYQEMFHSFLLMLAEHPDASLQWLSYKLNFNDYHKKRDSRLSASFTYQHRRMSLINASS